MFTKWNQWFRDRLPLSSIKKALFEEGIPGGAKYSYALGSAALFLLVLLVLTGIWQMFVYVPTVDHAYTSLSYLRIDVPFGWLVHGLHYWGAAAFAVVVGVHIIRVFIWGAYKKPRELVWFSGIFLLLLTVLFMFTGPILPWDKKGYWACKVGFDMIGSLPWIGSLLQSIFWGSESMGQAILSRMFAFHVVILPALIGVFVVLHVLLFRRYGSAGTWKKEKQNSEGRFWPDQIFKDTIVSLAIFVLLVSLTVFVPPPFSGAADPLDTIYIPKPEWTFSFFYQLLKYFPGPWEPLGIAGIPLLILLFFASLPFIDRSEERHPLKRPFIVFFWLPLLRLYCSNDDSRPSQQTKRGSHSRISKFYRKPLA